MSTTRISDLNIAYDATRTYLPQHRRVNIEAPKPTNTQTYGKLRLQIQISATRPKTCTHNGVTHNHQTQQTTSSASSRHEDPQQGGNQTIEQFINPSTQSKVRQSKCRRFDPRMLMQKI